MSLKRQIFETKLCAIGQIPRFIKTKNTKNCQVNLNEKKSSK